MFAVKKVEAKEIDNNRRDELFSDFCTRLVEGINVKMFSRKYGECVVCSM